MRVPVVIAILAAAGASGLAAALDAPALEAPLPPLPAAPVIVFDPAPIKNAAAPVLGALDATAPVVDAVEGIAKRVDKIPRQLLLVDGSLVLDAYSADERALPGGIELRDSVALPAPALPAPQARALAPSLPDPAPALAEPAPARSSAPREPAGSDARVFAPDAPRGNGAPPFALAGGLLIGAAALAGLLYHRIRPNAALENETRKVIFDAVCALPGLGVHEISKTAGVSYSTATYHLERLVSAGMIVMTPDGNKLCYYKNGGAFSESERRILPLLKNEEAAKLFEAILEAPGTYRAALAEKLGVTATTINWHLRRLRDAGLVDETRAGRSAHLYARVDALRPTLLALATKVEPSEPPLAERIRRYAHDDARSGVGAA